MTPYEIAELAFEIERNDVGIKGGRQDQYAATFGGFNFIEFHGKQVIVTPLKISPLLINELEYNLLLCYTGEIRESQILIEKQIQNYRSQARTTLDALDEIKQLAVEMKKALLLGRINEMGALLHHEWQFKKATAQGISTPFIDELYDEARKSGAVGGKIAGAGGGGYMLLYCPFHKKHKVSVRLTEMGGQIIPFRFDGTGLQTWRVND